jgi:hypothetical protein
VLVLLSLGGAGCNNLFGLESSVADTDRDGIADVVDNCPLDPNPQQRDTDGNGVGDVCDCVPRDVDADGDGVDDACDDCVGTAVGKDVGGDGIDDGCEVCAAATGRDRDADGVDDACDACADGPPHDEDQDGVDDACDRCPSLPDDGEPAVAGVLGRACDRGTYSHQLFDPLTAQDITLWPGKVDGWKWQDDSLSIMGPTGRFLREPLTPSAFVEVAGSTTDSFGVSCRAATAEVACDFVPQSQLLVLSVIQYANGGDPLPPERTTVATPAGDTFRIELTVDAPDNTSRCRLLDEHGAEVSTVSGSYLTCARISIRSTSMSTLRYVWIVNNDP